jgi:phosphoglycerate dehydrogenase-like enzyme
MSTTSVLILQWMPDGELARWRSEFPDIEFVDGNEPGVAERHLPRATIVYGVPDLTRLHEATQLRWIQLASAGVPAALCGPAQGRKLLVTNLAGLYGPSIAEHALAMMLMLSRNLHVVHGNQQTKRWDQTVNRTMRDLHGRTVGLVGLGNIGQNVARLCKALGMQVLGSRRRPGPTPNVDRVYGPSELRGMLGEADYVVVAAPLVAGTEGMLGPAEFTSMKTGAMYINVSRGGVAQESSLLEALRSGRLVGAGLDVFAVEPLASDHPFWTMPQVLVSPHYSGDTVNFSTLPARRFVRNLHSWLENCPLEGQVHLDWGY